MTLKEPFKKNKNSGFSFIEVLIALVVVMILTLMVYRKKSNDFGISGNKIIQKQIQENQDLSQAVKDAGTPQEMEAAIKKQLEDTAGKHIEDVDKKVDELDK